MNLPVAVAFTWRSWISSASAPYSGLWARDIHAGAVKGLPTFMGKQKRKVSSAVNAVTPCANSQLVIAPSNSAAAMPPWRMPSYPW